MYLLAGKFDFLVHGLKDMPTLPPGFALAAITECEDPSYAVVIEVDSGLQPLDHLPPGFIVGSSSGKEESSYQWKFTAVGSCGMSQ